MLATWPMVFAALGGGVVIGLLALGQPPAQQSQANTGRPATTETKPAKAQATEPAHKASDADRHGKAAPVAAAQQEQQTCEKSEWPYRDAFCLDRTVKSPQALQMVMVRPADPAIVLSDKHEAALQETQSQKQKDQDSAQKQEPTLRPKPVPTTIVPAKRQAETAPPARRRASRERARQRRAWADSQPLPPEEARDLWNDEPHAYTERNGRIIYVYPERRYYERHYLPPGPRGPFNDW